MTESPTSIMNTKDTTSPVPAIEFQNVSKSFGPVQALRNISFTVPQGQVWNRFNIEPSQWFIMVLTLTGGRKHHGRQYITQLIE